MPVCGGVEVYNERSLRVKYSSQGVQTSFYESIPSAQDPLGDTTSHGFTEDSGNARANIPNSSKECNLRDTSRFSRVLFERIPGMQGFWRVESSNSLKATECPHRRTSLSHAHNKISAEYTYTNTSRQQEVPLFCLRKQGIQIPSTFLQSEH